MAIANQQPSISIDKLRESVYGSGAKKKSILKTIKYPSAFINAKYKTPKNAVSHFLVDENDDLNILLSKRPQIDRSKANPDSQKNNKLCCLQAIDGILVCANTILTPYLQCKAIGGMPKNQSTKIIDSVSVRLNPDIVLLARYG